MQSLKNLKIQKECKVVNYLKLKSSPPLTFAIRQCTCTTHQNRCHLVLVGQKVPRRIGNAPPPENLESGCQFMKVVLSQTEQWSDSRQNNGKAQPQLHGGYTFIQWALPNATWARSGTQWDILSPSSLSASTFSGRCVNMPPVEYRQPGQITLHQMQRSSSDLKGLGEEWNC